MDASRRRAALEQILEDARSSNADKLRALELLDRLPPTDDPREFNWREVEDELGPEGIDLLLGTPVLSIAETAQRIAREMLEDDEAFNREVRRVAEGLTAEVRAQARASAPDVSAAPRVGPRKPRRALRSVPVAPEVLERCWPSAQR